MLYWSTVDVCLFLSQCFCTRMDPILGCQALQNDLTNHRTIELMALPEPALIYSLNCSYYCENSTRYFVKSMYLSQMNANLFWSEIYTCLSEAWDEKIFQQ